ncbi:hypothetical protein ACFQY0_19685 [Haloferula chungangensis]|uniref:Porin n=1 Tax=Haloferula chungangensis TaxID=1048331 RepID=A0ABW2LDJ6_9BACT
MDPTAGFKSKAIRGFLAGVRVLLFAAASQILLSSGLVASDGDWWKGIPWDSGVLVDDAEGRWVQSLQVGGYAHFQSAFVDGSSGGRDFWYGRDADWRRVRATVKGRALGAVDFLAHLNMVEDEGRIGGGVEVDYFSIFQAWTELDLLKLVDLPGVESMSVAYGKRKLIELNEEVDTSINAILTVERSALANQVAPFRAGTGITGAWIKGGRAKDQFSLGLFTTDTSAEFGNWDDGTVLVSGWRHDFSECWGMDEATVALGAAWQDVEGREERYSVWEWVVTPWMRLADDRWGLRMSAALGSNEGPDSLSGGAFYGFGIMPFCWLIEGQLQGVLRYEIMASEAPRGVGMPSRYAREAGLPANEGIPQLALGAGDFHESLYAGVVWTIIPKHMTMLFGAEWERMKSRDQRIYEGLTAWFSTRLIF